jgi:hypothetical protein
MITIIYSMKIVNLLGSVSGIIYRMIQEIERNKNVKRTVELFKYTKGSSPSWN